MGLKFSCLEEDGAGVGDRAGEVGGEGSLSWRIGSECVVWHRCWSCRLGSFVYLLRMGVLAMIFDDPLGGHCHFGWKI